MQLHSVRDWLSGRSTWGVTDSVSDVRTLRRVNGFYDRMAVVGEVLAVVMLIGLCGSVAWLMTQTSFEDIVFWDSTEHICMLDSRTGEIRYAKPN